MGSICWGQINRFFIVTSSQITYFKRSKLFYSQTLSFSRWRLRLYKCSVTRFSLFLMSFVKTAKEVWGQIIDSVQVGFNYLWIYEYLDLRRTKVSAWTKTFSSMHLLFVWRQSFVRNNEIMLNADDIFAGDLAVIQSRNLNIPRLPSQKCSKELKISRVNGVR